MSEYRKCKLFGLNLAKDCCLWWRSSEAHRRIWCPVGNKSCCHLAMCLNNRLSLAGYIRQPCQALHSIRLHHAGGRHLKNEGLVLQENFTERHIIGLTDFLYCLAVFIIINYWFYFDYIMLLYLYFINVFFLLYSEYYVSIIDDWCVCIAFRQ